MFSPTGAETCAFQFDQFRYHTEARRAGRHAGALLDSGGHKRDSKCLEIDDTARSKCRRAHQSDASGALCAILAIWYVIEEICMQRREALVAVARTSVTACFSETLVPNTDTRKR